MPSALFGSSFRIAQAQAPAPKCATVSQPMKDPAEAQDGSTGSAREAATADVERLLTVAAGDALFVIASGTTEAKEELDGLAQRRAEAYAATLHGQPIASPTEQFDSWFVEIVRAMAAIAPPTSIPMMHVIREKVTLEVGARGLRSLFSSKPSDKDVARVRRIGSLVVRSLRAVFAADGPIDAEEQLTLRAVVSALGLPEDASQALSSEPVLSPETLDVYGDIDHGISNAIVRGMWWAAAADGIDPREEHALTVIAKKIGVTESELEEARREAHERLETRSKVGAAAVDGVRFVLADRCPGLGVRLPALVGTLIIPRRWRDEALRAIGQGAPLTLARRHAGLSARDKFTVLSVTWASVLMDNPTVARKALLRARWEQFAADLGADDYASKELVDRWVADVLAHAARAFQ